jgi:hypothetical protein
MGSTIKQQLQTVATKAKGRFKRYWREVLLLIVVPTAWGEYDRWSIKRDMDLYIEGGKVDAALFSDAFDRLIEPNYYFWTYIGLMSIYMVVRHRYTIASWFKTKPLVSQEFELEGEIKVEVLISADDFWDDFIGFVEFQHWYCGGGLGPTERQGVFYVSVCISTENLISCDVFNKVFNEFLEKKKWAYEGTIREIQDGYYMNEDESSGARRT